jgi:hypothetical protein
MSSHRFLDADSAAAEVLASMPGLYPALESAAERAGEAMRPLSRRTRSQAFPDVFRAFVLEELAVAHLADHVRVHTGPRNSVVFVLSDGVRIRLLKGSRTGLPPAAKSRARRIEYAVQNALPLLRGDEAVGALSLVLTWQITAAGVELCLSLPKFGRRGRYDASVQWQTALPYTGLPVPTTAEDVDDDDLVGYRRRAVETGEPDRPA